jgi:hypothetical protein
MFDSNIVRATDTIFSVLTTEQLNKLQTFSGSGESGSNTRNLQQKRVIDWAEAMGRGEWMDRHPQGLIVCPDTDRLSDGQHRVNAEVIARKRYAEGNPDYKDYKPVEWRITFMDISRDMELQCGKKVTIDVADNGKTRSNSDYIRKAFNQPSQDAQGVAIYVATIQAGGTDTAALKQNVHVTPQQVVEAYGRNRGLIEDAIQLGKLVKHLRLTVAASKFFAKALMIGWKKTQLEAFIDDFLLAGRSKVAPLMMQAAHDALDAYRCSDGKNRASQPQMWCFLCEVFDRYQRGRNIDTFDMAVDARVPEKGLPQVYESPNRS